MVHGGRDQKQRFGRLLWNLVERKPILLRAPDAPVRQVFSGAVVDALLASSIRGPSRAAWNLAWSDEVTSGELVDAAARSLGTTAVIRPEQTATTDECFLNSKWMSALDASAARRDLAFTHPPLDGWLAQLTHAWLSRL